MRLTIKKTEIIHFFVKGGSIMFIDLNGKIKNTSLTKSQALFPLFEAVINSFQSIEYLDNKSNSYIKITLEKDKDKELIKNIIVEDNGIGFNNSNYKSFNTSDSSYKSLKGCMGLGRFKWLKAFENVKIESIYMRESRIFFKRTFTFNLYNRNFINEISNNKCKEISPKTVVYLENLKKEFKDHFPQKIDDVALKIIKHCLSYFMYRKNISVTLSDGENTVNLNEMFANHLKSQNHMYKFSVLDNEFEIIHIRNTLNEESMNTFSLCANNREVKTFDLSSYIEGLSSKIKMNDEEFYYHGYVYGAILDKSVNSERSDFHLDKDGLSEEIILDNALKSIKNFLRKYLDSLPINDIKEVEEEETSEETLEKTDEVEVNNESETNLTKYLSHRKEILGLLKNSLNVNEDGTYSLDEYVQNLIFPMKSKLDEVTYDNHNLWVIDDKLTFHHYLGCDNSLLRIHENIEAYTNLLVINNPIAVIDENEKPYCSLSILYFNKPMRTNYSKLNPIDEIQRYIIGLRNGKQIDRAGRIITLTENAIINVYLICDLNYELLELIEIRDFQATEDKLEYTLFHKNLNCFIKVMSYDKMLQEANRRNKVLFDKLED